jgi:hypothetical protein
MACGLVGLLGNDAPQARHTASTASHATKSMAMHNTAKQLARHR